MFLAKLDAFFSVLGIRGTKACACLLANVKLIIPPWYELLNFIISPQYL